MGASEKTAERKFSVALRLKLTVWGAAAAGLLVAGLYGLPGADARGETRTMTLYSVNTKERLTTTYMVNGKHVPSELAKINHLLRDWRRDAVTKIDTRTIDLMWELHADLGSRAPIHIISAYRSVETNAMLRRIGRNVAKHSMHSEGKAIDLYFPDVPTERLRNSALVRDIGGVGYYPRSGSAGFVHIDSGRVRHWPGIGTSQMARIRRDYRQTVGARLGGDRPVMVASAETPAAAAPEQGYPTPTPRPRPIEVLMMAAAQMNIEPAAAPVPRHNFAAIPSPIRDSLADKPDPKPDLVVAQVIERPQAAERPQVIARPQITASPQVIETLQSNASAKGSFVTALRDGISASVPDVRPLGASIAAGAQDLLSWPAQLIRSAESLIWRDAGDATGPGTDPEPGSAPLQEAKDPFPPITEEDAAEMKVIIAALRTKADYDAHTALVEPADKADGLSINRAGKGDLILTAPPPRFNTESAVEPADSELVNQAVAETFQRLLNSDQPAE
jgi:uncharacterized protein YcbK (DUF882 family)